MNTWITSLKTFFWHRHRRLFLILVGLPLVLAALAVSLFLFYVSEAAHHVPEAETTDRIVYLNKSWGDDATNPARQTYYFTPQGASMPQGTSEGAVRYQWFLHLEQPLSQARFASPEYLQRFRFLLDEKPSDMNPDHLPVGFTRHFNEAIGEDVLDITCAACHTGELHYQKDSTRFALRVDGGQAMHAFTDTASGSFAPLLMAALIETYVNPAKFDRFAHAVTGGDEAKKHSELHQQLGHSIRAFLSSKQNQPWRDLYPVREGFGRTDALGRIGDTVFGDHLVSKNLQQGNAPVSYPYLWNIWKFNWVQYNGSVSQPLARNIGEVLGVGAIIPLRDDNGQPFPASQRFRSSVRIPDLERIEKTLQTLAPPQWPSEIFGEVDATLAAQGQQLFEQHCRECHGPHLASEARQKAEAPLKKSALDQWLIEVIPVEHIGTDSTAADGFLNRHYDLTSTGLTRQEIAEVLHPSLRRQLARDVLYHLQSLAIEPNNSEAQKRVLISALNQYPAPDSLADANFVNSPFEHMSQQLRDAALTPQKPVKETDAPYQALQCDRECHLYALNWLLTFGRAQAEQTSQSFDPKKLTEGVALNIVGLMIKQRYFEDQQLNTEAQQCLEGFGTLDLPQQIRGYKPRPLAGVWATPPFLHNGSVPSIYQMLMPPEQRDKRFFTGPREYDPKYLGYKNESDPEHEQNGFWFDTSLQGNHNTGHGFSASTEEWQAYLSDSKNHALPPGVIGPEFTHEQRMAIIEYLKIHQDNTQAPADYSAQDSCLARAE